MSNPTALSNRIIFLLATSLKQVLILHGKQENTEMQGQTFPNQIKKYGPTFEYKYLSKTDKNLTTYAVIF